MNFLELIKAIRNYTVQEALNFLTHLEIIFLTERYGYRNPNRRSYLESK